MLVTHISAQICNKTIKVQNATMPHLVPQQEACYHSKFQNILPGCNERCDERCDERCNERCGVVRGVVRGVMRGVVRRVLRGVTTDLGYYGDGHYS